MRNAVVPNELEDFSSLAPQGEPALSQNVFVPISETLNPPVQPPRSYQPYRWNLLNQVLDFVDLKTNGRAGVAQRFVSYLFFGGTAAVVNLVVFFIGFHVIPWPANELLHNTLAYLCAAEISILANFIPNDRFTFNLLPGAKRPWIQRCSRFHMTAVVGTILTYLIELGVTYLLHVPAIIGQAIALLLVLIYNFSFHHLFTYRHMNHAS